MELVRYLICLHTFLRCRADNRLTKVTEGLEGNFDNTQQTINTNTFRGDGQRISKIEYGQVINYVYQDGSVLYTTDNNHDLINLHLKAPDGALISMLHARNNGNQVSNFTTDVRQSTSTVLCDRGAFFTGFRYTDFGETTRLVDTDELIEIAYTGGVWDEVTGLYYLNARFYNPIDARFLQMDVARNGGDLRATLSLYGYCEGDPINKVDPSGYSSTRRSRWVTLIAISRAPGAGSLGTIDTAALLAGGALTLNWKVLGVSAAVALADNARIGNRIQVRISARRGRPTRFGLSGRAIVTLETRNAAIRGHGITARGRMLSRFTPEYLVRGSRHFRPGNSRNNTLIPGSRGWSHAGARQDVRIPARTGRITRTWTITNRNAVQVGVRFRLVGNHVTRGFEPRTDKRATPGCLRISVPR